MNRLWLVKYFVIATGLHLFFSVANADQLSTEKTMLQANKRWQPDDNLVSGYGIALSYPSDVLLHVTRNVERGKSVYEFKVFTDGRLEYNGHHGVEIRGIVKKQLAPQDVEKIKQLIDQSGIQGGASGLLETSYKRDGREYTPLAALYVNRDGNIKRGVLANESIEHLNFWVDLEILIEINDWRCPTFAEEQILGCRISNCKEERGLVKRRQESGNSDKNSILESTQNIQQYREHKDIFIFYSNYEYGLTIYTDGFVEYFGRDGVNVRGFATMRLRPTQVALLERELGKLNLVDRQPKQGSCEAKNAFYGRLIGESKYLGDSPVFGVALLLNSIESQVDSRQWRCPMSPLKYRGGDQLVSDCNSPSFPEVIGEAAKIVENEDVPIPSRTSEEWQKKMLEALRSLSRKKER